MITLLTIAWYLSWYVCGCACTLFFIVLTPNFKDEFVLVIDSSDIVTVLFFGLFGPLTFLVLGGIGICLFLLSILFNGILEAISGMRWFRNMKIIIPIKAKVAPEKLV